MFPAPADRMESVYSLYLTQTLAWWEWGMALFLVDWPTVVLQCLTVLVGSSDP